MKIHSAPSKFKYKYRIASARIADYDYASNGKYFVTICTGNRKSYFGEIINEVMQLSNIGFIAKQLWLEIPNKFQCVELDEWVIMPNHLHGIIAIDRLRDNKRNPLLPHRKNGVVASNKNPMLHENLSSIIRWYKGKATFEIRKITPEFFWQERFHEYVIRNDQAFYEISEYIINNPLNWKKDTYYGVNSETR